VRLLLRLSEIAHEHYQHGKLGNNVLPDKKSEQLNRARIAEMLPTTRAIEEQSQSSD
jgi:hypothetical protein